MLADPVLEARAREISEGLRCLVCQNQSIDDSNAPLAHDLRVLVRERLKAGDSNDAVRKYLVARYGDFILLKPPFEVAHVDIMVDAVCGARDRRRSSRSRARGGERRKDRRFPARKRPLLRGFSSRNSVFEILPIINSADTAP